MGPNHDRRRNRLGVLLDPWDTFRKYELESLQRTPTEPTYLGRISLVQITLTLYQITAVSLYNNT